MNFVGFMLKISIKIFKKICKIGGASNASFMLILPDGASNEEASNEEASNMGWTCVMGEGGLYAKNFTRPSVRTAEITVDNFDQWCVSSLKPIVLVQSSIY